MTTASAVERARAVAEKAYAPYSRFHVGCVVETEGDGAFEAANMENASYGLSICAEVGALAAANAGAGLAQVRRVIVAGGTIGEAGALGGTAVATPCGRCRQLILEAAQASGHDLEVVCVSGDGATVRSYRISELLPDGFDSSGFGRRANPALAAE